jgi:hypothetical protein
MYERETFGPDEPAERTGYDASREWTVDFTNGRIRCLSRDYIWVPKKKSFEPTTRLLVGDGTVVRKYLPIDENEWMQGARLTPEFGHYQVVDMRDFAPLPEIPLLFAYRLPFAGSTPETITAEHVDISKWTVETRENDQRVSMALRNSLGQLMVQNVLNPANAFAIEETRIYSACFVDSGGSNDELYFQIDIKNQEINGLWLPKAWTFTEYSPKTGEVRTTVDCAITKTILHSRVEDSTFTIDIPDGAIVRTSKGPRKMAGNELVAITNAPQRSRKGQWVVAAISLVSAVLVIVFFSKRRFVNHVK